MPSRERGGGGLKAEIAARGRRLKVEREALAGPKGPPPEPPPTLSHFAEKKVPIRVECEACWRKVDLPAAAWMERFGDVTMMAIERRASCSQCGEKRMIDARPLYERRGEG